LRLLISPGASPEAIAADVKLLLNS
jgi:hypothetical protein